jgi:hypothetical protein
MVALTVFKFTARKKIVLENKENVRFFRFKENKIVHHSTDEEEKKKIFAISYYSQTILLKLLHTSKVKFLHCLLEYYRKDFNKRNWGENYS